MMFIKKLIEKIPVSVWFVLGFFLVLAIVATIGYYCGICYAIQNTEVMVIDENVSLLTLGEVNFWTINRY